MSTPHPPLVFAGTGPEIQAKGHRLIELFHEMPAAVVAFSGGVDSGLLAAVGYYALGSRLLAVTVHSPVETPGDADAASALARQVGFPHRVVAHDDLSEPSFTANPPDRCYHCKLARFRALAEIAEEFGRPLGGAVLVEGSNADDAHDYRPGARAVAELGVRSPLAEAGLSKAEIRALAHAMGLAVWDRPSAPCLATRFPYGAPITREGLSQVAAGEAFLHQQGFRQSRVRHFNDTARLEIAPNALCGLMALREETLQYFRSIGFTYVVVDLAGYRSGSMNEVLKS
jgi:pyridinium-3,5-biscarboxylic acid mononucleotide sulfurtransferase